MSGEAHILTLAALNDAPILSPWVAAPIGAVAFTLLAIHLDMLLRSDLEGIRRRLRTAIAVLAMCIVPLMTFALAGITPADERRFALAWLLLIGLVWMVLVLGIIDLFVGWRVAKVLLRERREELARLRAELRRHVEEAHRERNRRLEEPQGD